MERSSPGRSRARTKFYTPTSICPAMPRRMRASCFCATGARSSMARGCRSKLESLFGFAPDDFVEPPEQRLALGVRSRLVDARLNAGLRLLRDPPILPVRQVPELDGVVGMERRLRHFL